ncbi:chorismate synthase [Thermosporothrix hazakensis]|jgi:chorismate synthase|uniref:Chorismate synthase n=2 Tax=Thermosporothrix TaxID=768650 RepID=A0A326TZW1_THEHA|nr:chorismate synthase [Thermosporothrix hazakensis]PZW18167.1 chorismate synthase [Thermosporothrix hazakensis]BBH89338.1 chorismate synthase [Thermosporothrix sp. COM3]GCE47520.1 chorismate synthase [Thermosporothrix hazakensis]
MFRFLTAGESHGPGLTIIVEGLPAGLTVEKVLIDADLRRRQGGYGRGGRMKIEKDEVRFLSGVRHGKTLGSPITMQIENRDWVNWEERMNPAPVDVEMEPVTRVRPGHADFTGAIKYGHSDVRNVIERSSSRETAARVAVGGLCRQFLQQFGITIHSHVLSVVEVGYEEPRPMTPDAYPEEMWEAVENSPMRCADAALTEKMIARILEAKRHGDTCGGVFEVVAFGVPIGLGSFSQWDRRLSTRLAMAMMSIPSAKGVEIGAGFGATRTTGSHVHDVLRHREDGSWYHLTNNAGGIEGGISNGEPIVVRVGVKPIPTLAHPLPSVDIASGENIDQSRYERSDVCVVPAAGVVGEAMMAVVLTEALLEKYGGDSMDEMLRHARA